MAWNRIQGEQNLLIYSTEISTSSGTFFIKKVESPLTLYILNIIMHILHTVLYSFPECS